MQKNLTLFLTFFKIGLFTFGGGYAMIPLIQREIAAKRQWINEDDLLDIIAIAESTPGPIAVNASTFVGFKVSGFWGAVFATVGIVLPSFVIISLISLILRSFSEIKLVQYAFNGVRAGVLALIIKALWTMYKQAPKGVVAYAIMGAAFVFAAILGVNVLLVIVFCAVVGLVTYLLKVRNDA